MYWFCITECCVLWSHCGSRSLAVTETHCKHALNPKPSFWPLWNVALIYLPNVSVHQQRERLYEITWRNPKSGLAFFLGGMCEGCRPKPEGNCSGPAIRWTQGAREFPTESFCRVPETLENTSDTLPIVTPKHPFLLRLNKLTDRESTWKCRKLKKRAAGNRTLKLI